MLLTLLQDVSLLVFNNNLIICFYHSQQNGADLKTITFPITFTNIPTVVNALGATNYTVANGNTAHVCNVTISNFITEQKTGFSVYCDPGGNVNAVQVNWFCITY